MTIAVEQSAAARVVGIVAILVVAAVYLYVRERRHKKRR